MTVSIASFRADFPNEFGNQSVYPDTAISYWIAIAGILMGVATGSPPTVASFTGSISGLALTVTAINFGSINPLPLLLTGSNIPANEQIVGQTSGTPGGLGVYLLNTAASIASENMVAVQSGTGLGMNPFWGAPALTANSPPTTKADFAMEMWVAHQLVLEKQCVDAAQVSGDPGTRIGVITSKSVGGVSVSFDVGTVTGDKGAGYYAQTIYGLRFWRLARMAGAGPLQIGIGQGVPFLIFQTWGWLGGSNAWAGPYPGIEMGDTGFGG